MTYLTPKSFRALKWRKRFEFDGFKVFTSKGLDNVAIVHERRQDKTVRIRYRVEGRWTDSPNEAVRIYNTAQTLRIAGGRRAPGSPKQA